MKREILSCQQIRYHPTKSMRQDIQTTLADLIRINSVNSFYPNGPGESELSFYIEHFLRKSGMTVVRQCVVPETATSAARENLIAMLPGRISSSTLVLEAHMDTVSIEGMTIDPFEPRIDSGRMYGRGSVDTKAGLAAMMHAVTSMAIDKIKPNCNVCLAAVVDEEHSFLGVTHFLKAYTADAAIIAEPTSLQIVSASKGVLRWKIVTEGKSAHSARVELGINAIEHMARLITKIESLHQSLSASSHPLLGSSSGNIGTIRGGVQINFVPDRCEIQIDRRLLPDEDVAAVFSQYQAIIDDEQLREPSMKAIQLEPMVVDPAFETPMDSKIVQVAQRANQQLGLADQPVGVPFGSDASKFSRAGIPSIIFGPGSIDQAHSADEYVELEQVERAIAFYREVALAFE
jgi:acetylornithine deacetylase/succinyl-diaminopimelate desuccinylase family protein